MKDKILLVDDEKEVLNAFQRLLNKNFNITTATNAKEGIARIRKNGPYAVVVSDLRMPGIDGIEFLQQVKKDSPDTVRIMLSGNAELPSAIDAVNNGEVFRFLTKPCSQQILNSTILLGIRQYQLVTGERELLDETLKGSIKMMSEMLSFANSSAFSLGTEVRKMAVHIANALEAKPIWQYEVAALLSQTGCIAVPKDILNKVKNGSKLTEQERKIYDKHPEIGANLIRRIPRLEKVSDMIASQLLDYRQLKEKLEGKVDVILGASILRTCINYSNLSRYEKKHDEIIYLLLEHPNQYAASSTNT